MRSRYLLALAAMAALALSLAACGGGGGSTTTTTTTTTVSPASAKETFCADLKNFSAALTGLQGLDPDTASKEDVTSAASDIKDAGQQVESSAKALGEADTSAVQSALDDLEQAVKDLPSGNTLQEDLTALQPALQATAQSFTQIFNGQGCSTSSS